MRLLLFLPLLAACSPPAPSQEVTESSPPAIAAALPLNAVVDAQNSYGRHHLDDPLSNFKGENIVLVPRLWPAKLYTVPSDSLYLGKLRINGIGYEFRQGKLYRISFNSRQAGLREAGQQLYGVAREVSPAECWWEEKRATANYTEKGNRTYLRIFDNDAAKQVDAAVKAARPR